MKRVVSFHRLAEREIIDAAHYYDLERDGLGESFLREVERALDHIEDFPDSAPILAGNVRKRLIRRFPYAILYSVYETELRVLAVMNLKRRPFYWADRS
jgi:plasmid stabilization system protein ParE